MPWKTPKPCIQPGCKDFAVRGGRCEIHAKEKAKEYRKRTPDKRPNFRERGYGTDWDKARAKYIKRHPDCENCGEPGPEGMIIDHIVEVRDGGKHSQDNLRTLCRTCHGIRHANERTMFTRHRQKGFGKSQIPVVIVAGPPGAGKTTWVKERLIWGDLVLDVDALFVALTGGLPMYDKPTSLLPFVMECRDAAIGRLARPSEARRCWIITGKADLSELERLRDELGASELVILETSPLECVRRIGGDPRRKDRWELWQDLVQKWFRQHHASRAARRKDW